MLLDEIHVCDTQSLVEVGDIVGFASDYDTTAKFYIFLGYAVNARTIDELDSAFNKTNDLCSFEEYKRYLIEDYSIRPLYYNFANVLIKQIKEVGTFSKAIINKEITEKYILDMLETFKSNYVPSFFSTHTLIGNKQPVYVIHNVVDKKFIHNYLLKLQLVGVLSPKLVFEDITNLINRLHKAYVKADRRIKIENERLKYCLKESKSTLTFEKYGIYGKNLKTSIRLYVCLGFTRINEPVFLPLVTIEKSSFNRNSLSFLDNVYWLQKMIKNKKFLIGTRDFYSLGIKAVEPKIDCLTFSQRDKLREIVI